MAYRNIILFLALSATLPLTAQHFSLGIKGGYSLSNPAYKGKTAGLLFELQPASGFHAGLEGRWELDDEVAILLELQYSKKGYNTLVPTLDGPTNTHYILNYAALPIAGSFHLWKGLSVQAGVEAEWLLKSKGVINKETFDPEEFIDLYNDFDLGILAGLEYAFGKSFFITARHIFGVTPLSEFEISNENGEPSDKIRMYHQNTQIAIGYRYYFGQ